MALNCDGLKFENAGLGETPIVNPKLQALVNSVKFTVDKPATKQVYHNVETKSAPGIH